MKIASLVVRVAPEHIEVLKDALQKIPGVELHGASAELGRVIVTVEDGEGYAMTDSLLAVNLAPHALGVTLAYEYTDEGLDNELEHPEPIPGLPLAVDRIGSAQDKEA
ncbi:chaperone NapD [Aromatoleum petrolei]|uniref:Chaperone NapD n=1 Tax=Aromatoleum petrolei TaxID=76116 RepID=A0ABX1MMU7_9RHOO|nr:chaperone NapD [Aromatoleum petrolei]NMF88510.1 nitrate reductase [Aromatoleum petrolei]QTQ36913.1 Chaperone NapD [Aromatoleum petrolei]